MIESFSQPEDQEKILLKTTEEIIESYGKRALPNWRQKVFTLPQRKGLELTKRD